MIESTTNVFAIYGEEEGEGTRWQEKFQSVEKYGLLIWEWSEMEKSSGEDLIGAHGTACRYWFCRNQHNENSKISHSWSIPMRDLHVISLGSSTVERRAGIGSHPK